MAAAPIFDDPLDRTIVITDKERQERALSPENRKLGAMLLHARGFVILKGAVPETLVDQLRSSFSRIYADCCDSMADRSTKLLQGKTTGTMFWERKARFRIFPRLSPPFSDPYVLANPFATAILKETLGDGFYCKSVSSDTCVNGAIKQAPHRDLDFYNGALPAGATVNIPIMRCGLHNGPLEVWPGGSHLWHGNKFVEFGLLPFTQDGENPSVEDFAQHVPSKKIDLRPGDLLIRDPGMWHRGNPNPTDEPRTMLTTAYFRSGYFYEYGDPLHNLDRTLYDALDPSVRGLFSYVYDGKDASYWKLRYGRANRQIKDWRYLGAPLRIGSRWWERLRDASRKRRG
jgi:hypothetical protein